MIPFHFDGSGKRRREIRLQGSSAQQQWNKETLLQKAQEERRVRQRERDRQEAARRLQRWIRRTILPRHRIMSQLESDWIQAMKTLKHPPTFENLLELQLQGWCLWKQDQSQNYEKWRQWLLFLNNADSPPESCYWLPDASEPISSTRYRQWLFVWKRWSWQLLQSEETLPYLLAGWCRFIQVDPRGKEFGLALIQYWIDRGFFSWLRQRFLSGSQLMQQYVYLALIPFQLAAGTPAETSPWMTHAVSSFCTQLMSLPMHTLLESNSIVLEYWYKQWPLEAIIKHLFLQNQTVLDSSLSTDILVIQGYRSTAYANALVQFIDGIQKRWDRVQCWAFPLQLAMVMAICSFLPFVDADWIHEKTENMDEEEEEDEVEAQQQSSMMKLPKDPHNLQSLSQLDNTQWFEMIFRRAPVTLDVKSLIALSRISLICQPRLANTQAFFINSWLIRPQWIRQLWDISRENQLFQCAKQADPRVLGGFDVLAECFQNEALRDSWILLLQLTEVLRRLLMTYGKDEFYGDENILGVTGFTELTSVLKFVVVFMYLKQDLQMSVFSDLMAVQDARKSIGQLLQQIHVRNCAKQFCMNEVFHVESLVELDQLRTALHAALGAPELNDETQSSPYVQILFNIPFVIPFNDRVVLFRDFVENDARSFARQDRIRVRIHRDHVFEDSMAQLNELASRLRHQIQITFISELGYEEAGIDGGGVFKEFLSVLSRQAFDPNLGLFSFTHEQLLYPNPHSYSKQNSQLAQFEFLGRIMGKALYEGILIEASFAIFFLNKWLGRNNYLDDLASLDPELYKNLMFLKNYEGNVEDLALNFTITSEEFGETKSIELFPNGKETPVTNENRIRYIFLVTNYKLNVQIGLQCRAFLSGLSDLIQPKWLQIFNQYELHILVSGSDVPIDLNDLRRNTVYSEDYNETNSTIAMFWRVVSTFSEGDKRKLVKFVTSCPRPPLLGFKELCPKFSIRRAEDNQDRLPTTSTCVNLLKLPPYKSEDTLREKLLYAINAAAGFELS